MTDEKYIKLTKKDVDRLIADDSPEVRADTAKKVARVFDETILSKEEKEIAEDVFRIMVHDAEIIVRKALADNLKDNPYIPHDVAKILARDVEEVAIPIIQYCNVFTPEDLIEIVEMNNEEKTIAVAGRPDLTEKVSEAIADKGGEEAVATLVANEKAIISQSAFEKVIDRFPKSKKIHKPLVYRTKLPVAVAERLVNLVSDELKETLIVKHDLPPDIVSDIIVKAREETTIKISAGSSGDDIQKMISQMNQNGRLTASVILRALCMGDMTFFEYAMAELSDVPVRNCRILLHDSGALGLEALYEKTNLPKRFYPIFRAAVDVINENYYDGGLNDIKRYSRRTIERILTKIEENNLQMDPEDIEYLLGRLSLLPLSPVANE